jgi:hypothetical protein
MNLRIGKVNGYEIRKNRDGVNDVLLLQVEVTDPDDIQTVEFYQAAGRDSNPPINSLVAFLEAGNAWKIALGADDGIIPDSESGEEKLYSSASGAIKAFVKFFKTGLARLSASIVEILSSETIKIESTGKTTIDGSSVDINGDSDNAVRFSVLESEFNRFKSDFDEHTHVIDTQAGITQPAIVSSADISGAKVDEVKLP